MIKKISKLLDQIITMEFLAKWLLAWGIAANIIFIMLLLSKSIRFIAGL